VRHASYVAGDQSSLLPKWAHSTPVVGGLVGVVVLQAAAATPLPR